MNRVLGHALSELGIAQASGGAGELIPVCLTGISPVHHDLVVGAEYGMQSDGTVTHPPYPAGTAVGLGKAISPTSILMKQIFR